MISTSHQSFSSDQIKKHKMGGACSTYEREESKKGIWRGNIREGEKLEDRGVGT